MSSSNESEKTPTYAMNVFSKEAANRSRLFESLVSKEGFALIGGRFGGEFNNDQLSIRIAGGTTQLLLGLKVTDDAGNLQLDTQSMGPYQQFSRNWLLTVSHALKLDPTQASHGKAIESALADGTLVLGILMVTKPDGQVRMLRITLPD